MANAKIARLKSKIRELEDALDRTRRDRDRLALEVARMATELFSARAKL
jgi:outer membrane murein-binding lipoprotein Lpp